MAEGFAWLAPARREAGPAEQLDLLLRGLDSCDAFELDARMRRLRLAAHRIDFQMAALLHVGIHHRLFREIGFASVKLYVESRLGCSARTVWSLVAVERECWRRARPLREAWRDGRVSHLAAAVLLPVLSEGNAKAWIDRAGEVTLRRLQDEVAWALDRIDAGPGTERPFPPGQHDDVRADGTGDLDLAEVRLRTASTSNHPRADASEDTDAAEVQMRSASTPTDPHADPSNDSEAEDVRLRSASTSDDPHADPTDAPEADEVKMRAHVHGGHSWSRPVGRVRLEWTVPLSVAVLVETTLDRIQREGEPRWRAFERMVAEAVLEWRGRPRHPDPVFERDGWRCTVPGCSSRRNLHDHHLLFRSHGGGNARDNRTTVCAAHHLHGLHAGIVRAWGRAPADISWELGCRQEGRPLLRLHGDRYVTR